MPDGSKQPHPVHRGRAPVGPGAAFADAAAVYGRWLERRNQAVASGIQAVEQMLASTSLGDVVAVQQQWSAQCLERWTADARDAAELSAKLFGDLLEGPFAQR